MIVSGRFLEIHFNPFPFPVLPSSPLCSSFVCLRASGSVHAAAVRTERGWTILTPHDLFRSPREICTNLPAFCSIFTKSICGYFPQVFTSIATSYSVISCCYTFSKQDEISAQFKIKPSHFSFCIHLSSPFAPSTK